MHYYQFNIADYRKDTMHLSRLEHSIYRDLIDWCYLDESCIPLDTTVVMRKLRLCSTDDERALKNVLTDFFERTEDGYVQGRIQREIAEYHRTIENASKAGKASAEARKTKKNERPFNDRSTTVQPTNNQEPITNNQEPIKSKAIRASRFDAQAHLVDAGIPDELASDWIRLRKTKKAEVTKTAIEGIQSEAQKACISLETALRECCARGWAGFKASWLDRDNANPRASPATQSKQAQLERRNSDVMSGWVPPELRGANGAEVIDAVV